MKKYLLVLGLCTITSFIVSCSDFLDEDIETFYTEDQIFATEAGLETAVTGLYQSFARFLQTVPLCHGIGREAAERNKKFPHGKS